MWAEHHDASCAVARFGCRSFVRKSTGVVLEYGIWIVAPLAGYTPTMKLFTGKKPVLIGMIHVQALPASPRGQLDVAAIVARAVKETGVLRESGFGAVMIENMHDAPYVHGDHGPEVTACMTRVALAVRAAAPELPLGVQVLSGGCREAVAIALAAADSPARVPTFIRCENFVFSHVGDEGLMPRAEAGPLLRYRRSIGADSVSVFVDIKKKHASHALTGDVSIGETAKAAEFFGADGVIVTGRTTGEPVNLDELREVRRSTTLPVLVGSGATPESTPTILGHADAIIVGSWIKKGGVWSNAIDPKRCAAIVKAFDNAARR